MPLRDDMRRKTNAGGIYDRILSTYNASDIFTDREAPREAFWNEYGKLRAELTDPDSDDTPPHILLYYGISGIGKTRLLTEIGRELDRKKDETGSKSSYRWVMYDFTDFGNTKEDVIKGLAHLLSQKYGFRFPMTALAETKIADEIGRKPDMEMPTIEDKIRSSKIGNTILNVIKFTPFGDIAENIFDGIETIEDLFDIKFLEKLNPWFMLPLGKSLVDYFHHADLRNVRSSLEAAFSFDLDNNLEKTPDEPLVIMLDTYERYTHIDDDTPTRGYLKDLWLRRHDGVIAAVPGILWVIAGREKLGEIEKTENPDSWNALGIKEHLVGNLASNDIRSYLNDVGITDTVLQDHLIELTGGVPLLLDMARETFVSLNGDPIKQRDPALYGHNKEELVVRALDNMGSAFSKLSTSFSLIDGGWTDDMIAEIHGSLPGWDDEIYTQMKRHSMVNYDNETNQYSMHPVIKDILLTRSGIMQHTRDEINEAVFSYRLHTCNLDMLSGSDTVSLIRLSFYNKAFAEPFFDEHMLDVILSHIASGDEDYLDTVFDTYETALRNSEEELNGLRNKLILSEASTKLSNGYSKETLETARQAYDYILKHYSKDSSAIRDAAIVYGSVLLYTGQYSAARNTFSHLLKDNADSDTPFFIQYGLGRANLELRDYDSALEAAEKAYATALSSGNEEEMSEAEILKLMILAHSNQAEGAADIVEKLWEKRSNFTLAMLGDAYAATIYAAAADSDDELANEYYDSLVQDIRNPAVLPVNTQRNIFEALIKAKRYIDDNGLSFRIEELYTMITERHGYMNATSLKASIAYAGYISTREGEKSRKLLENILDLARLIFGQSSLEVADILSLLSTVISYKEKDYRQELENEASSIYSRYKTPLTADEYKDRFYKAIRKEKFSTAFSELLNIYLTDRSGRIAADCTEDYYSAIRKTKEPQAEESSSNDYYDDYYEDYYDRDEYESESGGVPYECIINLGKNSRKTINKADAAMIISGLDNKTDYDIWKKELSSRLKDCIVIRENLETSSIGPYIRKLADNSEFDRLKRLLDCIKDTDEWTTAIENIANAICSKTASYEIDKLLSFIPSNDYETVIRIFIRNNNEKMVRRLMALGASLSPDDYRLALEVSIEGHNPDMIRHRISLGTSVADIPVVDLLEAGLSFLEAIALMAKGAIIRDASEFRTIIKHSPNEESIRQLFEEYSSLLPQLDYKTTIEAVKNEYSTDIVSECIHHGYDIENDSESYQLIIGAFKSGRDIDFIENLIGLGADPLSYMKDDRYRPPQPPDYSSFEFFDFNVFSHYPVIAESDCNTLLFIEFLRKVPNQDVIRQLIKDGADINGKYEDDNLPIISSLVSRGISTDHIRLLLRFGADINTDMFYDSPLIVALECQAQSNVIAFLLKAGAEITPHDTYVPEFYNGTCYEDFVEKRLSEEGYDMLYQDYDYEVNEKDSDDEDYDNRLWNLSIEFQVEWDELTADIQKAYRTSSALMFAIQADSPTDIVEILINAGADVNAESVLLLQPGDAESEETRTTVSVSPLAYAVMLKHSGIAKTIYDYGGREKDIDNYEQLTKHIQKKYADFRGWEEAIGNR